MTTTTAKTRSWWGWGNVDDAVTGSEKEELLNRVRLLLPDADLSTHEPPRSPTSPSPPLASRRRHPWVISRPTTSPTASPTLTARRTVT